MLNELTECIESNEFDTLKRVLEYSEEENEKEKSRTDLIQKLVARIGFVEVPGAGNYCMEKFQIFHKKIDSLLDFMTRQKRKLIEVTNKE